MGLTISGTRRGATVRPMGVAEVGGAGDEVEALLGLIEPEVRAFKLLVREADRAARSKEGLPEGIERRIVVGMKRCECLSNDLLGEVAPCSDATKEAVGARLQAELLPYLMLTENGGRWYDKPAGYAGDYLTIEHVYDDLASGAGAVGPLLDRAFLELSAARAVRNRRRLLAAEIHRAVHERLGEVANVTSLACGPAREVFDVYTSLRDPSALAVTLVDTDADALAYVAGRKHELGLTACFTVARASLLRLVARGPRRSDFAPIDLPPQDLIYSIGLIDHMDDAFVVRLLDFAHAHLRSGGRVLLGNFHPSNDTHALIDHVLDWHLVHRSEADMNRLFAASRFGAPCSRILFEDEHVNLFAEGVRV